MQAKFKAQAPNDLLAELHGDPRASLASPAGTIARGQRFADPVNDTGATAPEAWVTAVPDEYTVDAAFLQRGQERFAIYCTPCHGTAGAGDGLISLRAAALAESQAASGFSTGMVWVAPANLADPRIVAQPVGQIYGTITNGLNNMQSYKGQIYDPADRWAIASFVKALQLSQTGNANSLTDEQRSQLDD